MSRCSTDFPDAEPLAARDVGGQALLNTALSNDERNQAADDLPQLTVRAILGGLAIGTVLCFTNMYFGLQTGWVTMGSIQCAVVGFAVFRFCAPASSRVLSMHENVVLQAVGVATATAPLSAGFVGIIPALQMLHPPHGPANIAIDPLVQLFWALSLTYFGIFFAVPLRRQVILVEQLRFPSGTATAKLIEVLHTRDDVRASQNVARMSARQSGTTPSAFTPNAFTAAATPPHGLPLIAGGSEQLQRARWRSLSLAFSASFLASLLAYFVPSTANLRIFDLVCLPNLSFWHWTIRPSLSYVGQGMIMGLRPAGSAFGGAVLAWGLLGPIALSRGWTAASHANATAPVPTAWGILEPVALSKERTSFNASAPVLTAAACAPTVSAAQIDSWEDGAQGWLLWVALALMLGEAITSLALIIVRQGGPALRACLGAVSAADRRAAAEAAGVEVAPPNHLVPLAWWGPGLLGSGILTVAVVSPLFNMPVWQSAAAVVLSCFVSVLAVRALGQTDLNPVSGVGKLSQIIFAGLSPGAVVSNVVAGAIAEAGAMQVGDLMQELQTGHLLRASSLAQFLRVGDLMQDLKTGHLLRASPRAQFLAQLIGATASAFVTVGAYQLYTRIYSIPSAEFPVPVAHIWKDMAVLMQKGLSALPSTARDFAAAFGACGIALPLLELLCPPALVAWLPSGVSVGIGMYVTADWTIPRLAGAVGEMAWRRLNPAGHKEHMLMVASGFVLGEGVMSICALGLTAAHTPKLG